MSYLTAAWAWFSGLGWIGKASAALTALTPGLAFLGPVGTILGALWTAIRTVVTWLFEGLELCITHPVVISVIVLAYVGGRYQQHHVDSAKIEAAHIEAQNIAKKIKGAEDVEAAKAKAAIEAREAAKALPLVEPNVVVTTVPPLKPAAPPIALNPGNDGVRKPAAIRRRAKCEAVFCF